MVKTHPIGLGHVKHLRDNHQRDRQGKVGHQINIPFGRRLVEQIIGDATDACGEILNALGGKGFVD